jgi:ABC-2 type transport system ATP-binding protein
VLEATGTDDIETAFLRLIERGQPDLRPESGREAAR